MYCLRFELQLRQPLLCINILFYLAVTCRRLLGPSQLRELVAVVDCIPVCCAQTSKTEGIISEFARSLATRDQVLIYSICDEADRLVKRR